MSLIAASLVERRNQMTLYKIWLQIQIQILNLAKSFSVIPQDLAIALANSNFFVFELPWKRINQFYEF